MKIFLLFFGFFAFSDVICDEIVVTCPPDVRRYEAVPETCEQFIVSSIKFSEKILQQFFFV